MQAVFGATAIALAACLAPAHADDDDSKSHERARQLMLQQRIMPLETIQDQVLKQFPGRLIGLELEDDEGLLVYEFKVLSQRGKVLEIEVDARTGAVLEVEEDD